MQQINNIEPKLNKWQCKSTAWPAVMTQWQHKPVLYCIRVGKLFSQITIELKKFFKQLQDG